MQSGALVLALLRTMGKHVLAGTAFQQVMADHSLQQKGSFSMNVGQDLVCVILQYITIYYDSVKYQ